MTRDVSSAARRAGFGIVAISFPLTVLPASAQDITFTFNNPSFGGNPFNSSHYLGLADIQRQYDEPQPESSASGRSDSDLFVRQLQSRLLSSLSSSLAEAITGAEPGASDTVQIGDQEIFYERSLTSITIEITNLLDGSSTVIEVPVLDDVGG